MNIDGYLHHVHQGLAKLEQLIITINDTKVNRLESKLKTVSKPVLANLPQDVQAFTLDDFVEMQKVRIREGSKKLKSKNQEVESAVDVLEVKSVLLSIAFIGMPARTSHDAPVSAKRSQSGNMLND